MLAVFDVNETLLDLAALDDMFAELTGSAAARQEWFDLLIHTALTVTATGAYRPFAEIAGACLTTVGARYGRTVTQADREALGTALGRLPPHADVIPAFDQLRSAGTRLAALGNSAQSMIEEQLRNAGLSDRLEAIFSAERAGMLKPAPIPYRLVLELLAVSAEDAVMVAAHDWDIAGAQAVGMRTAFITRNGRQPLPGNPLPTITAADLTDAAHQLLSGTK
jgi:2-haloacid dehalogenase